MFHLACYKEAISVTYWKLEVLHKEHPLSGHLPSSLQRWKGGKQGTGAGELGWSLKSCGLTC